MSLSEQLRPDIFVQNWRLPLKSFKIIFLIFFHQLEHETVAQSKLDEEEARVKFPDEKTEIKPPR